MILSGPSGSGKTTLYQRLLKDPRFKGRLVKSISATTRPRRPGERTGRDYLFLRPETFRAQRQSGQFLESQKVFRYYYGTPRQRVAALLSSGRNVLLCIDVKGAKAVWRQYPDALKIFIKTPRLEDIKKRLQGRGTETAKDLSIRLKIAHQELKEAKHYDYVVVNDVLEQALQELVRILCLELGPTQKSASRKGQKDKLTIK